jgi:hypothetical protein
MEQETTTVVIHLTTDGKQQGMVITIPVVIHQAADGVVEKEPGTVGRIVTHCTTSLLHQAHNLE